MEPRPGKKPEDLTALCEALSLAARGWEGKSFSCQGGPWGAQGAAALRGTGTQAR